MSHILQQEGAGQLDNLKISQDYIFIATSKLIRANDIDVKIIVSVFNVTTGTTVFIAGSETYTGNTNQNEVVFDVSSSGMLDSDKLYIIYQSDKTLNTDSLLQNILDELKANNKILTKIQNPE